MVPHLVEKRRIAQLGLNSTWQSILSKNIAFEHKLKIFKATSKAVMGYAAQVLGFKEYEEVERLQRFFLKKVLALPSGTPTYMLHLETGVGALFVDYFRVHAQYILRVMNMPETRYPLQIARETIKRKAFWFETWERMNEECAVGADLATVGNFSNFVKALLPKIEATLRDRLLKQAAESAFYTMYAELDQNVDFLKIRTLKVIRQIARSRCEQLGLNAKVWNQGKVEAWCSMCNLGEEENSYHFFCKCPIMAEFRVRHYGKTYFEPWEVIQILNGGNWFKLYGFLREALHYSRFLNENFSSVG